MYIFRRIYIRNNEKILYLHIFLTSHKVMKKGIFIFVFSLVAMTFFSCTKEKKSNIVLNYYNFSLVDESQLKNGAVAKDGYLCLNTDSAYFDMTEEAGKLMAELTDFSIFARYMIDDSVKIEGYGYFLWCFSCLEANAEKEGPYHAYRINEQRCETSIGGWSQETGIQKSEASELGRWITVVFRQKEGHGELYIDGELIGAEDGFPNPKDIFTEAPAFNWLGRAPFNGDKYLTHTTISDFYVYGECISDEELYRLTGK